jgi:RNA polymerase sigma-70 factor, ECF subfamily
MSQEDPQLQLIRRASSGDSAALELLLLQYRGDLLRYIAKKIPEDIRRTIEPQDILQDVYFEVFRKMESFRATEPGMALRWMLRIARNRLIDLVRLAGSAKRGGGRLADLAASDSDEAVVRLLQDLAVYERTPSRSAAAHELLAAVQRCMNRLPPDYREALRCRYLEGMGVNDIAARMNRTSGSVLMLCNRGLKALRVEMGSFSAYL